MYKLQSTPFETRCDGGGFITCYWHFYVLSQQESLLPCLWNTEFFPFITPSFNHSCQPDGVQILQIIFIIIIIPALYITLITDHENQKKVLRPKLNQFVVCPISRGGLRFTTLEQFSLLCYLLPFIARKKTVKDKKVSSKLLWEEGKKIALFGRDAFVLRNFWLSSCLDHWCLGHAYFASYSIEWLLRLAAYC